MSNAFLGSHTYLSGGNPRGPIKTKTYTTVYKKIGNKSSKNLIAKQSVSHGIFFISKGRKNGLFRDHPGVGLRRGRADSGYVRSRVLVEEEEEAEGGEVKQAGEGGGEDEEVRRREEQGRGGGGHRQVSIHSLRNKFVGKDTCCCRGAAQPPQIQPPDTEVHMGLPPAPVHTPPPSYQDAKEVWGEKGALESGISEDKIKTITKD